MEADETFVDAATREPREETGLDVRPEWIEAPRWRRQIEYVYRGVCHLYPRSLPTLLPRFLAGESLEEPLEIWSPDG
jgi:8-oxo-dGTP pyrophosphatase MutT (NUDIX family)